MEFWTAPGLERDAVKMLNKQSKALKELEGKCAEQAARINSLKKLLASEWANEEVEEPTPEIQTTTASHSKPDETHFGPPAAEPPKPVAPEAEDEKETGPAQIQAAKQACVEAAVEQNLSSPNITKASKAQIAERKLLLNAHLAAAKNAGKEDNLAKFLLENIESQKILFGIYMPTPVMVGSKLLGVTFQQEECVNKLRREWEAFDLDACRDFVRALNAIAQKCGIPCSADGNYFNCTADELFRLLKETLVPKALSDITSDTKMQQLSVEGVQQGIKEALLNRIAEIGLADHFSVCFEIRTAPMLHTIVAREIERPLPFMGIVIYEEISVLGGLASLMFSQRNLVAVKPQSENIRMKNIDDILTEFGTHLNEKWWHFGYGPGAVSNQGSLKETPFRVYPQIIVGFTTKAPGKSSVKGPDFAAPLPLNAFADKQIAKHGATEYYTKMALTNAPSLMLGSKVGNTPLPDAIKEACHTMGDALKDESLSMVFTQGGEEIYKSNPEIFDTAISWVGITEDQALAVSEIFAEAPGLLSDLVSGIISAASGEIPASDA
jgi:hypothetical protein